MPLEVIIDQTSETLTYEDTAVPTVVTDSGAEVLIITSVPGGGGGGGGSVNSVNGVTPDVGGNITLAKSNIGLGSVDNTSDVNKPVSTAQNTAINKRVRYLSGTIGTAVGTAAKTVTIAGETLATNDVLILLLTNGNTATQPTLALNGGSAIQIHLGGSRATAQEADAAAGGTWFLHYDGSRFNLLGASANLSLVSQAEAEAGTATAPRFWTAERVKQAVVALAPGGGTVVPETLWYVDNFGAVGDGTTNDAAALQAAFDAATTTGGAVVLGRGKKYGWSGIITIPHNVRLIGHTTRQNLSPDLAPSVPGLIALSTSSQLKSYGGISNVYVDGNFVGADPGTVAKAGLVRIGGVDLYIEHLFVSRSGGDGIVYDGLQNSTISGCASTLNEGCALVMDNGAGALSFHGGYYGTSKGGTLKCRDTAGETNAYPFGPTHNTWSGTIFEAYPDITTTWPGVPLAEPFTHHVQISGRSNTFLNCNFTGGAQNSAACTVLIDSTASVVPTTATFVSCLWWVRGGHDAVRVVGSASVSFIGQQEIGDNGTNHATSFCCVDNGVPHISVHGEIILAGDTNGSNIFRTINSGSLLGVYTMLDGGVVNRLRSTQATGWRREGDALNRFQIERDGLLRWLNGVDSTTRATLDRATVGNGLIAGGRFTFNDGVSVIPDNYSVDSASKTVTIDSSTGFEHRLAFTATGMNVTTLSITNAIDGGMIRIGLYGTGTNSVTWPSSIVFKGTAPQPTNGQATMVDLVYVASLAGWYEVTRSNGGLTKSSVGLSNVDNTSDANKPISKAMARLLQWAKVPDSIITGSITRNGSDVVTSAAVVWPDGATGTFTTDTIGTLNTIDAYHITYNDGVTSLTFTQPAVTRNGNGAVTNVPTITVA